MMIKIGAFIALALIAAIVLASKGVKEKNRKRIMIPIAAFLALCALIFMGLSLFITSM